MPADLAYVHQARDFGFILDEGIDITANVAPTMDMAHAALVRYVEPTAVLLDHFLSGTAPVKAWHLKRIFSKQLQDLGRIYRHYQHRTDPSSFRRVIRYVILRFSRQNPAP